MEQNLHGAPDQKIDKKKRRAWNQNLIKAQKTKKKEKVSKYI